MNANANAARAAKPAKGTASPKGAAPTAQTPAAPATLPAKPAAAVAAPKAPTALEVARANVAAKAAEGVGVTHHTSGAFIKGLVAEPVLARPQRKMLRTISKIWGHPGQGNCVKRFHLYREGMTLLECKTTPGLIVSDVTFYAQCTRPDGKPYLELGEATDAEYAAAVAEWEAKRQPAPAATEGSAEGVVVAA